MKKNSILNDTKGIMIIGIILCLLSGVSAIIVGIFDTPQFRIDILIWFFIALTYLLKIFIKNIKTKTIDLLLLFISIILLIMEFIYLEYPTEEIYYRVAIASIGSFEPILLLEYALLTIYIVYAIFRGNYKEKVITNTLYYLTILIIISRGLIELYYNISQLSLYYGYYKTIEMDLLYFGVLQPIVYSTILLTIVQYFNNTKIKKIR